MIRCRGCCRRREPLAVLSRTLIRLSWRAQSVKSQPTVEHTQPKRVAQISTQARLFPRSPRAPGSLHRDGCEPDRGKRKRIPRKARAKPRSCRAADQQGGAPSPADERLRTPRRRERQGRVAGRVQRGGKEKCECPLRANTQERDVRSKRRVEGGPLYSSKSSPARFRLRIADTHCWISERKRVQNHPITQGGIEPTRPEITRR